MKEVVITNADHTGIALLQSLSASWTSQMKPHSVSAAELQTEVLMAAGDNYKKRQCSESKSHGQHNSAIFGAQLTGPTPGI